MVWGFEQVAPANGGNKVSRLDSRDCRGDVCAPWRPAALLSDWRAAGTVGPGSGSSPEQRTGPSERTPLPNGPSTNPALRRGDRRMVVLSPDDETRQRHTFILIERSLGLNMSPYGEIMKSRRTETR